MPRDLTNPAQTQDPENSGMIVASSVGQSREKAMIFTGAAENGMAKNAGIATLYGIRYADKRETKQIKKKVVVLVNLSQDACCDRGSHFSAEMVSE